MVGDERMGEYIKMWYLSAVVFSGFSENDSWLNEAALLCRAMRVMNTCGLNHVSYVL